MPHRSTLPPISIPEVDIWTFLCERTDKPFPGGKEILTDAETGRTYTSSGLEHEAREFGKGLVTHWGWKKGDVLALYTPNSVDTAVVTLGAIWAGGVVSPANPLYTARELTFQLKDSGAKALVTQTPFLEVACEAARSAGIPESRIVLIGDRRDETGRFRHFCSIRSTGRTGEYAKATISPKEDLSLIVYSSGTTGLPKGACLSHYNVVANILQFACFDGRYLPPHGGPDGKGEKLLGVLPLYHIYGLQCCILSPIYFGWQVVVMERFDLEKALQTIQNYGITFAYVPPPIVLLLSKHPAVDSYDLTSLKVLHSAAAPLTRELTEAVWQRLKVPVKQGFGMSEASPVCHMQNTDEWAKFVGSVGKLCPNMEAKLVDSDGKEVADGEPGELWLHGPNIFTGYMNNPQLTRDAFSPCGYLKTGDVFTRDRWGNYYCVDRLKELIKYKGFQVAPAELEGLLLAHPDVLDACVVGVEDRARATEVPRAYVVARPGVRADGDAAAALALWLARRVAPQKRLRGGVRFVDQVPKSPSGKILRRVMREKVRMEERAEGSRI